MCVCLSSCFQIVEFDSPSLLASDPESYFSKLLRAADLQKEEEAKKVLARKQEAAANLHLDDPAKHSHLTPNQHIPTLHVTTPSGAEINLTISENGATDDDEGVELNTKF